MSRWRAPDREAASVNGLAARSYLRASELMYGRGARAFDASLRWLSFGRVPAWRAQAVAWVRGPRVLEVGFGTGELLLQLASSGFQATGVEPSPGMQAVAAAKLRRARLDVGRVRGRAEALPFADGAFDTVLCTLPTAFARDPAALRELARVLVDGGAEGDRPSGRLVLAGVCAYAEHPVTARLLRLFWGEAPAARLARYVQAVDEAGLQARTILRPGSFLDLPTIIAEKPA